MAGGRVNQTNFGMPKFEFNDLIILNSAIFDRKIFVALAARNTHRFAMTPVASVKGNRCRIFQHQRVGSCIQVARKRAIVKGGMAALRLNSF